MKVLVCGGRDFADGDLLNIVLLALHSHFRFTTLVHGGARGADRMAGVWAKAAKIAVQPYPVEPEDWRNYGKAAGAIRNRKMLDSEKPDLVIAFPGDRGTADMMAYASEKKVPVLDLNPLKNLKRGDR